MKIYKRFHLRIWAGVFGMLFMPAVQAQTGNTIFIQGRVINAQQDPVIGAAIKVQGRPVGTTTDKEGKFAIQAIAGETLEISCIGYLKQHLKVVPSTRPLTIILQEDVTELENVVVVGYASANKKKLTGAVTAVSIEDLKNRPITDVSLALQGKVTGVQVTQNSGQPGADGGTITIRGIGTLNDSSPLVIIDGFESSFDKVDAKDIESMTVLKDAASAAIYGNKAANGVILITTRKGKSGKLNIEYNGYIAVQEVTRYPSLLGSVDYLELNNEALVNSGKLPMFSEEWMEHFRQHENPVLYPDRNWADFYFKPALQHNHHVTLNGGDERWTHALSLGFLDQDGILTGTEYSKYNFRATTTMTTSHNKLKITTNIAGHVATQIDRVNGTGATLSRIVQMGPTVNAKMEGYGWTSWFYDDAALEAGGRQKKDIKNFNGNMNIQAQLLPYLKVEGAINYDRTLELNQTYAPNVFLYTIETGLNGEQSIGRNNAVESQIRESTYTHGNLSSYATLSGWVDWKDDHHFKLLAGVQQGAWDSKYYQTERRRLTADLPSLEVGDPATQKNASWESEVTSLSLFGRFNYDFDSKYLFEANIRYDGSSKFAEGGKWGLFPSFSAGWRISEEPFLKSLFPWVDELKARASWGRLGNEKIWSAYAGTDILSVGSVNYVWNSESVTGSAVSYIANKSLTWETTTQKNFGLDFTIFRSFSFAGDFYIKETDNILMRLPVSSTFGFTEDPWRNAGKMRNIGYEFSLSYDKKFLAGWGINGNLAFSFNKNKIVGLHGMSPMLDNTRGILLEEGKAINTLYGYQVEGIYQSDDEIHKHLVTFDRHGNPVNSYSGLIATPGDIRFKDQNGDGIIDMDNDRVALGDPSPDFLFSFTGNTTYKGFDLTVFFQGIIGGEGWSTGELVSPFFNGYNSAGWMVDRWTPERPNNTYQRMYNDSQRSLIKSEYYVEDLSYLRLKNAELGYTLPAELLMKLKLTSARLFISGQNILTLTRYKGFDPERAGVEATNIYAYPLVKTFTAGIHLRF
ncbi:MAG: TonB-dependent receptor [Odoribacteraceae bacterium]|jgi:TonB-linked SusC/RagA family outer membrane protein|nr:TonB-dependent receptor [Odoribacteraceae bacterium]